MKKKDIPNYNRLFESSVNALQCAFNEYTYWQSLYWKSLFVNSNGDYSILGDYEKINSNISKACTEVLRLKAEVEKYRELKD